jgi:hypothetical protein
MTQEQTVEMLFWLPETEWRIVATLTATPAPATFNGDYVREWISEIASTVEFRCYPEAFIVTEIDEERHVRPLIQVLLGGTDESRLSEHDEPWRNSWSEISAGGFADIKYFREGQGPQAISHFANCLSETGIFYAELDLSFVIWQSADTGFYSKVWESLCVPVPRRKPSKDRLKIRQRKPSHHGSQNRFKIG